MLVLFRRLCLALFVWAVVASSISGPQAKQKHGENTPPRIGFLMDSLQVERWQTDLEVFQKRARELGADVLVETAEGDDAVQFEQAYKLLNSGIKALVIVAHDTNEAVRIVAAARAKDVPVLSYEHPQQQHRFLRWRRRRGHRRTASRRPRQTSSNRQLRSDRRLSDGHHRQASARRPDESLEAAD